MQLLYTIIQKFVVCRIILLITFTHLADAFIQSDLQLHSGYTFLLVHVFPGNRTHNLSLSWRNVLPLSHRNTLINAFIQKGPKLNIIISNIK